MLRYSLLSTRHRTIQMGEKMIDVMFWAAFAFIMYKAFESAPTFVSIYKPKEERLKDLKRFGFWVFLGFIYLIAYIRWKG